MSFLLQLNICIAHDACCENDTSMGDNANSIDSYFQTNVALISLLPYSLNITARTAGIMIYEVRFSWILDNKL